MFRFPRYRRSATFMAIALGASIAGFSQIHTGLAKEFEMLGTLECGRSSAEACPPATDRITVSTTAVSGVREQVMIDVSWVRSQLEHVGNKQDDLLCFMVEDVPGVGYRALAVRDDCEDRVEDEEEEEDREHERNGSAH